MTVPCQQGRLKTKHCTALLLDTSWFRKRYTLSLLRSGAFSSKTRKLCDDTYGQVPDLSPFPLKDTDCSPSVKSISLFVVARSSSSSREPEKVKISSLVWSDFIMVDFTEMLALSQVRSILDVHLLVRVLFCSPHLGPVLVRDNAILLSFLLLADTWICSHEDQRDATD